MLCAAALLLLPTMLQAADNLGHGYVSSVTAAMENASNRPRTAAAFSSGISKPAALTP